MAIGAGVEATSRALEAYLPELTDGKIRDRLRSRLRDEAERAAFAEDDVPVPPAYDPELDREGKLEDYFRHFVLAWTRGLSDEVAASPEVDADNTVVRDFVGAQSSAVADLLMRTLLRELFQRRSRGLLAGGTPEERYRSFRRWTNSPEGHRDLVSRYPLPYRMARDRVRAAMSGLLHIVSRVRACRADLDARIPGITAGSGISTVLLGRGDAHNGGRSVAQVVFADGGRVLYKPRPMESEAGYNALVSWFNERLGTSLRTVAVLRGDGEGFVEYVAAGAVRAGARGYFTQIGQLVGILHLVRAIDIHFENMVTCADGPVVVDTETLLTTRLRSDRVGGEPWSVASSFLDDSVVGIGVLPFVMRDGRGAGGMDVGVIGYDADQPVPYKVLRYRNPGRDDMYGELTEVRTSEANVNPSVLGTADLPVREQRDLIRGELRRVLEYAAAHKREVADAVEEFLGDATFRYLNRATVFYVQLLRMATHPDAMADPLVRAAVLHRVFIGAGDRVEIPDAEVRQLAAGDVPYFRYSARSRALLAGDGRVVVADAFERSGMEAVRARILGLTPRAVERQLDLLDFSFVGKLPMTGEATGFVPRRPEGVAPVRVGRDRLLAEAVRIGDHLVDTMVDGPDETHPAVWIGPQVTGHEEDQWAPGVLTPNLYIGAPGIALVLAGLARETGGERYRRAALRVVEPLERLAADGTLGETGGQVGGMSGLAGVVYTVSTARRLLGGTAGVTTGGLARLLASGLTADSHDDFVSGAAGALAVCLSLYRNATAQEDREAAADAAGTFARFGVEAARGSGATDGRLTEYTGYAHGAIGIAPSLLEYASLFGDREAHDLGTRMAEAVRDAMSGHDRDWPRRWEDDGRAYAWCHGAPGILLGALQVRGHVPDLFPEDTLARLAELTLAHGFGNNPTYCHGDLGALEVVLLAERELPGLVGAGVGDLYPRLFTEVVERYEERADSKYSRINGLMLGHAGRAWSVLRHLDPATYPSVLVLGG
jgi:type 2 lantibiotic biosynthesis protein LanM